MTFTGELKPYQTVDVQKIIDAKLNLNAYEMGLGKTIMSIAVIEDLKNQGIITQPTLIIALSSLKYQWETEIKKFTDDPVVVVIDGAKAIREDRWSWVTESSAYWIANYEAVVNDWESLKNLPWGAIICDEVTAIKGFRAKRAKQVKKLSKSVPVRLGLTGTPVENGKPEELFSIFQFVNDKVLGRWDLFDRTFIVRNQFGGVQRYRNLDLLHKTLAPWVVRKTQTDEDVAPYLPECIVRPPIWVTMDRRTKALYRTIASELFDEVTEAKELFGASFSLAAYYGQEKHVGTASDAIRGSIMSKITALRMVCDHPDLLLQSAEEFENAKEGTSEGSAYAYSLYKRNLLPDLKSQKLEALVPYIKEHLDTDTDAKVVVFASYVGMLQRIKAKLAGIDSVIYTGKMNAKQKAAAREQFLTDPDCRVFISSDAGGYGVDLPNANLLINYDLPWSSGLAMQRNGRIKRASSRWPVITIQDILIKDSIEERQHDMLQQKSAVADAIIDGVGINEKGGVDFTVGSLINFLSSKTSKEDIDG